LSKDLVLVVVDTQWFLHPWSKPEGQTGHCEAKSAADVTLQLDDILDRNKGKRVVLAGHHPVYTYGPYGGEFTLKDHIFPLTQASNNLWLPLPVIGSLWPYYRKIFGEIQDVAHPLNKAMSRGLREIMGQYPGTVYASGHEQSLQYIVDDSITYLVSGSGSVSKPVRQREFSKFASSENGFVRLLIKKNGKAEVEYHSFSERLYSDNLPKVKPLEIEKFANHVMDSLWVKVNASYQYEASGFRKYLLGENYRAEWAQKIPLLAFDIGKEKGGLKILQKGGGLETMALRLSDTHGHEYNLRSVDKYPTKALPPSFQKTVIQAVKQDQVSASHPYAAIVIPPLAQAAGIYHTNPKVIYAPSDPRWGRYSRDFAGQIMIFEERPDGVGKDLSFFGNPERIISTRRMLEHLTHDHDVSVDQQMVLRARLFDMWIGDWDRHDDQFRWGEFDQKKTKVYRPIPRDRDQAFFVNEGLVPHKWRKPFRKPNLEGFGYKIRWAPGLMETGRWFDRSFLNAMTEKDFVQMARELGMRVDDKIIDSAIMLWPPEIYNLHGKEIIEKMKARRSVLINNATDYYRFLARQVDVTGSNKREWFEGSWMPNGNLQLQMFKLDKTGRRGKLLYEREFLNGQTKEVRIYGLGGDDVFHFSGKQSGGAIVRIIGGDGKDSLSNESNGKSKLYLYDKTDGIKLTGNKVHDRTSSDPQVNEYDRQSFEYNTIAPRNSIIYNIDDGVFIGLGFSTIAHGFRKKPYQSHHLFKGAYAIKTSSFSIHYEGRFPHAVGKWDLELDGDARSPNYVNNFFGWGNESVFNQNVDKDPNINVPSAIDYYRMRFKEFKAEVRLRRKIGQWGYFKGGPVFQRGEIIYPPGDTYIKDYSSSLSESILGVPKNYAGVTYTWGIDKRDNATYTTRGIIFRQTSRWMAGLEGSGFSYHTIGFTLYQSFRLPARVTYVFNAGGGLNAGGYQLYQAQTLDGNTEVRGYRKT
ncbi:MAG TPA: BamA/TamA family outer membrane protein, partial [Cyclobacteriaceae bacterium]|nr:BamA/TamA family outer membrane protein [Cyclobacteriaceae bacterium]